MKTIMEGYTRLLFCSSLFLSISILSTATGTITMSKHIRDGETIISASGRFELGFFSPGNSTKRYLGIWYSFYNTKVSSNSVVWVANRETPINSSAGSLKVTNRGILVLLDRNETTIWSSNSSRLVKNPVAQLLESGNLVVREENDQNLENFTWQSFDYPCDTLLPGMKNGRNTITGHEWYLSSWKRIDDPSPGEFSYRLDSRGFPEFIVWNGSAELLRSGPWNGIRFSSMSAVSEQSPVHMSFLILNQEMYYTYQLVDSSVITSLVLNQNGILQRLVWNETAQVWISLRTTQRDKCDYYALCGAYGSCNIENSTYCECLKGFVPKFPNNWNEGNWSKGCVRRMPLDCQNGDGFIKYSGLKLPETRYSFFNKSMNLQECKLLCLKNCSCMAYSNLDIREGGSGCLLWFGGLIDIRDVAENGQEIYIRMASSEEGALRLDQFGSNGKKQIKIIVSSTLAGMLLLCLGLILYIWRKEKLSRQGQKGHNPERGYTTESQKEDIGLPLFDLATVANATNNF